MRKEISPLALLTLLVLLFKSASSYASQECVRIYYDDVDFPHYTLGRIHSIFVQNLLGHFPQFQQIVKPIEDYKQGEIDQCHATIYLGSYFENAIPEAFLKDFETTTRQVAWLGYSIWKYDNARLEGLFGHIFPWEDSERLTDLDTTNLDSQGQPTFFKNIYYRGEEFPKFGKFDPANPGHFVASYEMVKLKRTQFRNGRVLAWAEHNGTKEKIPYIIRSENRFYVADIPFAFRNEDDRYLIFSDLLFDILGAPPRYQGKKPAIFRIEDVHPEIDLRPLRELLSLLNEYEIPVNIALIPIYADPLGEDRGKKNLITPMHLKKEFMGFVKSAGRDVTFIWHGVTHQHRNLKNPYNGVSGDDFEFWDAVRNAPLAEDSPDFVLDRLIDGRSALSKGGLDPIIWEVPHYQASALDYLLFSRLFPWTIGRIIYWPYEASHVPDLSPMLLLSNAAMGGDEIRKKAFANLSVRTEGGAEGQLFPYEIYGDIYEQRILPENLGNIQPYADPSIKNPRSIDDLIRTARRNRVLRDVWGSLFFHTYCMTSFRRGGIEKGYGDRQEIRRLLEAMQKDYEFVNLSDWTQRNNSPLRPTPIVYQRRKK